MTKKIDAQIKRALANGDLPLLDIINHPNSQVYIRSDFWIFTVNIDENEDFFANQPKLHRNSKI